MTTICAGDNQTTGDALLADTECKISVGNDLVIWTKHFTTFATFSAVTIVSVPNNTGGGGGGGGAVVYIAPTTKKQPTNTTRQTLDAFIAKTLSEQKRT